MKELKAWVAMNSGANDVSDMSFFKTKKEAVKVFGKKQVYAPVTITFNPQSI